jgi:hypothetical protein
MGILGQQPQNSITLFQAVISSSFIDLISLCAAIKT